MGLPDQEPKDAYTADEVRHIIAREVMKHRMDDVERKIAQNESSAAEAFSDIKTTLKLIQEQLSANRADIHTNIEDCRKEFRMEVERDFATRLELQTVEAKVDKLTAKIVTGTAVIVFLIQLVFQVFG